MHRKWFSSSGKLTALWLLVRAFLCSDMVGNEAHVEESAALDDRLGMGDTDRVGSTFTAGVGVLCNEAAVELWRSKSDLSFSQN